MATPAPRLGPPMGEGETSTALTDGSVAVARET